jgi:ribokinase
VVASLGAAGAIIALPGRPIVTIHAEPVEAVDTTGAGDSLTAAMAFAVAAGRSVEDAVRFGVEVATAVVQHRGAQAAVPSPEQLMRMWTREATPASTRQQRNTIKENIS